MYNLIFDIGTINLSLCLTKTNNYDITKTEILKWNLYNISVPKLLCCYETQIKNKIKKCNKKAFVYNEKLNGYCSEHTKQFTKEEKKVLLKVSKNKNLANNFSNTTDNLILLLHSIYNMLKEPFYINNEFVCCNKINVYIENQVSLSNPTAKSISMIVYTFFKLKMDNVLIENVNFVSASVKTKKSFLEKYLTKEEIPDLKPTKNKKAVIVLLVSKLIKLLPNTPNNIIFRYKFLREYKKKDDLADSFIYLLCVNE
jgi:hypothetical protein